MEKCMEITATMPGAAIYGAPEEVSANLERIFTKAARLEELKRKELLRAAEVEDLYGLSKDTLIRLRADGRGPKYCQLTPGGTIYYRHSELQAFVERNMKRTHDQN